MFNNKKKTPDATSSSSSTSSNSINSLVTGTKVEGTIHANNDIRVDGKLTGTLNCKGRVIIGPEGQIEGEITCQNAVIEGKFSGTLNVSETLNVRETANIHGDINTNKLLVQSGAVFNVNCTMGGQKVKSFSDSNKKGDKKEPALSFGTN